MTGRVFLTLLLPLLLGSTSFSDDLHPTDCSDINVNDQIKSGVYTIYPTCDTPVQVYCDMNRKDTQSEPVKWTVIQRRMDGSVNFYRPWEHYKKGFGNKDGEYWLGLENLYQLTQKKKYELIVDLQDFEGGKAFAHYSSFSVESEAHGYKLHLGSFIAGGAGDSLSDHNGQRFSTFDKDQDSAKDFNCAESYLSGFWYNTCHKANPNGRYTWGNYNNNLAFGNVWSSWKGYKYGLKFISMRIKPVSETV